MLDLIVRASSSEDSIVMDFFCGSGTALAAAQRLGRSWIGVDSSETAINAAKEKLENAAPLLGAGFDVLRAVRRSSPQGSKQLEPLLAPPREPPLLAYPALSFG